MEGRLTPEREDQIIQRIASHVAAWKLTAPAILLLHIDAPVAFLGSQFLLAATPFLALFTGDRLARDLALLFEEPENVERLIAALEKS